jgi:hypothetical protein
MTTLNSYLNIVLSPKVEFHNLCKTYKQKKADVFPRLPVNWRPLTSGQSFHCYVHRNRRCTPMRLCNMRPTDCPIRLVYLSNPGNIKNTVDYPRELRHSTTTHSQAHYVSCSGDMLRHVTTMCKRLDFTFYQQFRIPRYSQGFQETTNAGQAYIGRLLFALYTRCTNRVFRVLNPHQ